MSEQPTDEEKGLGAKIGKTSAETAAAPVAKLAGEAVGAAAGEATEAAVIGGLAATPLAPAAPLIGTMAGSVVKNEVSKKVESGVTQAAGQAGATVGKTVDNIGKDDNQQHEVEAPKPHPTATDPKEAQPQSPKSDGGISSIGGRFANVDTALSQGATESGASPQSPTMITHSQAMTPAMNLGFQSMGSGFPTPTTEMAKSLVDLDPKEKTKPRPGGH